VVEGQVRVKLQNNWRLSVHPELGIMSRLNVLIGAIDAANPFALPNFCDASVITVGSDYSGQHRASKYEVYAFVIADLNRAYDWEFSRRQVRETFLRDGRRFSFKNLNDSKRAAALPTFLRAIDLIPGLLLVILVEKTVGTLFVESSIEESDHLAYELSLWPLHVNERLFRILHFNSLLIAGLTHPRQHVLWITDQDDVVANETMHRQAIATFGRTISHYLEHDLGHVRVATTKSDSGTRDIEDFVAVADFAAGAISEILSAYQNSSMPIVQRIAMMPPQNLSAKTRMLSDWFSAEGVALRRLVISIDPKPDSEKLFLNHWKFHGLKVPIYR
jgi:hypothetical protein